MQIFHEWVDVLRIDNGDISAILAYKDSWQCFKKMLRFAEEENKDDIIVGDGFKHSLFLPLPTWGDDSQFDEHIFHSWVSSTTR